MHFLCNYVKKFNIKSSKFYTFRIPKQFYRTTSRLVSENIYIMSQLDVHVENLKCWYNLNINAP